MTVARQARECGELEILIGLQRDIVLIELRIRIAPGGALKVAGRRRTVGSHRAGQNEERYAVIILGMVVEAAQLDLRVGAGFPQQFALQPRLLVLEDATAGHGIDRVSSSLVGIGGGDTEPQVIREGRRCVKLCVYGLVIAVPDRSLDLRWSFRGPSDDVDQAASGVAAV